MIARNASEGDQVWRESDSGNILHMGKVIDVDGPSNMLKVVWNESGGWATWEDATELDLRPR